MVLLAHLQPDETADRRSFDRRVLRLPVPGSTALRASIVVGAGSPSFRVLVRLVERLRVLPLPRWRSNRTQPIDERDMVEFLARTPKTPAAAGRSLDVCGPDLMTYDRMIERIAEAMEWAARTPAFLPSHLRWVTPKLPFSARNVLRREYSGFFGLMATFVLLEVVSDYAATGGFQWDPVWGGIFAASSR